MKLSKGKIKKLYSNQKQTKKVKGKFKKIRKIKKSARNIYNTNIRNITLKNHGGGTFDSSINDFLKFLKDGPVQGMLDYARPKSYRTIFKSLLLRDTIGKESLNIQNYSEKSIETIRTEHEMNIDNINKNFSNLTSNISKQTDDFEDNIIKNITENIESLNSKTTKLNKEVSVKKDDANKENKQIIEGRDDIIDSLSSIRAKARDDTNDIQQIIKEPDNSSPSRYDIKGPDATKASDKPIFTELGSPRELPPTELITKELAEYPITSSFKETTLSKGGGVQQRGGSIKLSDDQWNVINKLYNRSSEKSFSSRSSFKKTNKEKTSLQDKITLQNFTDNDLKLDKVRDDLENFFFLMLGIKEDIKVSGGFLNALIADIDDIIKLTNIAHKNSINFKNDHNIIQKLKEKKNKFISSISEFNYNDDTIRHNFLLSDYISKNLENKLHDSYFEYNELSYYAIVLQNVRYIKELLNSKKRFMLARYKKLYKFTQTSTTDIDNYETNTNYDEYNILKHGSDMYKIDNLLSKFVKSSVSLQLSNQGTQLQLKELEKLKGAVKDMQPYNQSIITLRDNYTSIIIHFLKICIHLFNIIKEDVSQERSDKGFKYHNDLNKEILCDKIVTDIFIPLCGSGITIEGDINDIFNATTTESLNLDVNMQNSNSDSINRSFIISSGNNKEMHNVDINDNLTTIIFNKLGHISHYSPVIVKEDADIDRLINIREPSSTHYISSLKDFKNNFYPGKLGILYGNFTQRMRTAHMYSKNKINLINLMTGAYSTAYPQNDNVDTFLKIIKKIENVLNDMVLTHYVFEKFIGGEKPLIIDKGSLIYTNTMNSPNLDNILDQTGVFNKSLYKINEDLKDCQLKEKVISVLFEKIDVTMFNCDGLLPLNQKTIDSDLSDKYNYHYDNQSVKEFVAVYTDYTPKLYNQVEKNIIDKLVDMYLYDNNRDIDMTKIYIHKYVVINLINKYLIEPVNFCKKTIVGYLERLNAGREQIEPGIQEIRLTDPNSIIGYSGKILSDTETPSYENYSKLLFCHNLLINENINASITKFEDKFDNFKILPEDIFIFGSNHDAKFKRANIDSKIHSFNDILSHLYYFDFSNENHIESDISDLITKIEALKNFYRIVNENIIRITGLNEELNRADEPRKIEINRLLQQPNNQNFETMKKQLTIINYNSFITDCDTHIEKLNNSLENFDNNVKTVMDINENITKDEAISIVKRKENYRYIKFIRETLYKNIIIENKDNLLNEINTQRQDMMNNFHETLEKISSGVARDESNPLKQINLANFLSNLDNGIIRPPHINKGLDDFIDEYKKRLKGDKINLDNKIKYSAFPQRRYQSWKKFTDHISDTLKDMTPAEKIAIGIVMYGYIKPNSDEFIVVRDRDDKQHATREGYKIISKDFTTEILHEVYNLSVRSNYSQLRNNLFDEIDETFTNKNGEKGEPAETSNYKEKGIIFIKTYLLDSIKNNLELIENNLELSTVVGTEGNALTRIRTTD